MIETYIIARDKFLKPGGKMFPSSSHLCICPFYDQALYDEQEAKVLFWNNKNFYNVDITSLKEKAREEKFSQPIIDTYDPKFNLAKSPDRMTFDFRKCTIEDLQNVDFKFNIKIDRVGLIHGFACWFEAFFVGQETYSVLSTSPSHPSTHWYQMRFLLKEPIGVNPGQLVTGALKLKANKEQSFDVDLFVEVAAQNIKQACSYDMKDPEYRGVFSNYYNYYNNYYSNTQAQSNGQGYNQNYGQAQQNYSYYDNTQYSYQPYDSENSTNQQQNEEYKTNKPSDPWNYY